MNNTSLSKLLRKLRCKRKTICSLSGSVCGSCVQHTVSHTPSHRTWWMQRPPPGMFTGIWVCWLLWDSEGSPPTPTGGTTQRTDVRLMKRRRRYRLAVTAHAGLCWVRGAGRENTMSNQLVRICQVKHSIFTEVDLFLKHFRSSRGGCEENSKF